jgi:uncharacterized protein (DUF1697 family)
MAVMISMLRGINVGGHNVIKMDALRALYESLGMLGAQTYVQSGNVVFRTNERNTVRLAKKIQDGIEKNFSCKPEIILRSAAELEETIARNPFAKRRDIEPGKLLVLFLANEPNSEGRKKVLAIKTDPEELHMSGREVYIYFPNGMGKTKFPWAKIDKLLGTAGTGRNWNSVNKLLEMANKLESAE